MRSCQVEAGWFSVGLDSSCVCTVVAMVTPASQLIIQSVDTVILPLSPSDASVHKIQNGCGFSPFLSTLRTNLYTVIFLLLLQPNLESVCWRRSIKLSVNKVWGTDIEDPSRISARPAFCMENKRNYNIKNLPQQKPNAVWPKTSVLTSSTTSTQCLLRSVHVRARVFLLQNLPADFTSLWKWCFLVPKENLSGVWHNSNYHQGKMLKLQPGMSL